MASGTGEEKAPRNMIPLSDEAAQARRPIPLLACLDARQEPAPIVTVGKWVERAK